MRSWGRSRSILTYVLVAFVTGLGGCGDGIAVPAAGFEARLLISPSFASPAGVVDVDRVRMTLTRPEDGDIALDTTVQVASGADSVVLEARVELRAEQEDFSLDIAAITPASDTAFRGGPITVTASVGMAAVEPIPVTLTYVGTGASAVAVRITTVIAGLLGGDAATLSAEALDDAGSPIAGTPIEWLSLDPGLAGVPDRATGGVLAAAGRGDARIVARLLTGPADTAVVAVQPLPTTIGAVSGDGQIGAADSTLATPLVVRLLAADGMGVSGVYIVFQVTGGGGTVSADSVLSDSDGLASVVWRLGSQFGAQSVSANSSRLAGSTVAFGATATVLSAHKVFVSNTHGQNVSVIDLNGDSTAVEAECLPFTCSEPRFLAVNNAGTLVATPFRFSDNVLLMDAATGEFVAEISDSSFAEPFAVAFTPDDAELWVANKTEGSSWSDSPGSVSVVDMATRTVTAVIDEQSIISPEGIAIAAGKAYVVNRGRGSVTIIDVATRTVLDSLTSGFYEPRFAVATPDGQWVYVSTNTNNLVKISTTTDTIAATVTLPSFGNTRNLAVRPDGAKIYAGLQNSSIAIIDVATDVATELTFSGGAFTFLNTYGVAVLRDGSLGFVTDEYNEVVWVFDPATGTQVLDVRFPIVVGSYARGIAAH